LVFLLFFFHLVPPDVLSLLSYHQTLLLDDLESILKLRVPICDSGIILQACCILYTRLFLSAFAFRLFLALSQKLRYICLSVRPSARNTADGYSSNFI
jgi:hypothetical protein